MYAYYMLAAFGPKLQPYLWWKRYITVLQMVKKKLSVSFIAYRFHSQIQFLLVFLHNAQLLWVPCDYPTFSLYFTLPNAIFFIYLFNDFYVKAYKRRAAKLEAEETERKLNENNNALKQFTNENGLRHRGKNGSNVQHFVKLEELNDFTEQVSEKENMEPVTIIEAGNKVNGKLRRVESSLADILENMQE